MKSPRSRIGMSLLEVMLALAILGTTFAVIGELSRIGTRSAALARDLSTAQIHGESLMAQIVIGLIMPTAVSEAAIDDPNAPGEWVYQIAVQQIDQNGLIAVQLTVSQSRSVVARPASFSLTRWMLDPAATTTSATQTAGSQSTSGQSTGTTTAQ